MATKKALQNELKTLGISFKSRDTKDALEALLKKATEKKHSQAPAKSKTTKGPSAKQTLRSLFDKTGKALPVEEVYMALSFVKPETVATMCGDLRSEKYCGKGGTIDIRKENGAFVRIR